MQPMLKNKHVTTFTNTLLAPEAKTKILVAMVEPKRDIYFPLNTIEI